MACDAWFKKDLSKSELLKIATSMEGHPDNVAPAIFGQATACFMEAEDVRMSHVPCADYHCLVMVPHYEVKNAAGPQFFLKRWILKIVCHRYLMH